MPNAVNKEIFESVVSRESCLKSWFAKLERALGLDYDTIKYYYLDKRSKRLSQAYLIRVREKNQKVRSKINNLKHAGVQHDHTETN